MNWSRLKHLHCRVQHESRLLLSTVTDRQPSKNSVFQPSWKCSRKFCHTPVGQLQPSDCHSCRKFIPVTNQGGLLDHRLTNREIRTTDKHLMHNQKRCVSTGSQTGSAGPPWRVLFFGTDEFSVKVLQILIKSRNIGNRRLISRLDVLSNVGQTRVRQYAESNGLTVLDWPEPDLSGQYDLGVLASFGHLIPAQVISSFPQGILNVHPSLLPRWRGASPIVNTILSRDQITGVSIMKLRPKHFDTGPILLKKEVAVPDDVTSFQLRDLLAEQGGQMLVTVLQSLLTVREEEQDTEGVTYAHKVKTTMSYIDWETETVSDIQCHHRAFGEFMSLRSKFNGKQVKLLGFQEVDEDFNSGAPGAPGAPGVGSTPPGTVVFDKKNELLCVRCLDGWAGFSSIVIKKTMTAKAFYNGYLSKMADRKLILTSVQNGLDKETVSKRILQRR